MSALSSRRYKAWIEATKMLHLNPVDHVVVSRNDFYSLRDQSGIWTGSALSEFGYK